MTAGRSPTRKSGPTTTASSACTASSSRPSTRAGPVVAPGRHTARRPLVRPVASSCGRAAGRRACARGRCARPRGRLDRVHVPPRRAAQVGELSASAASTRTTLWESLQVAEGSAEVAERLAAGLDGRVRLGAEVTSVDVTRGGLPRPPATRARSSRAEAVVCALPVGVLHGIEIEGVARRAAGVAAPPAQRPRGEGGGRLRATRSGATWARTGSRRASTCSRRPGHSATGCSRASCRPSGSACCSPSRRPIAPT